MQIRAKGGNQEISLSKMAEKRRFLRIHDPMQDQLEEALGRFKGVSKRFKSSRTSVYIWMRKIAPIEKGQYTEKIMDRISRYQGNCEN